MIEYAILGYLSWQSLTGYDLKKLFADSTILYWSGNNNQIYRALVKLHEAGLVSKEVELQEDLPPRKVYTITPMGEAALREWVLTPPELPQLRHPLHVQLAWAWPLTDAELDALLEKYESEVYVKLRMLQEETRRQQGWPSRNPREALLWERMAIGWIAFYENELAWTRELRADLAAMGNKA